MPADWPEEAHEPDGHADRPDNQPATNPARSTRPESDPPSRQEAYVSLRIAVSTEQATVAHQTTADDESTYEKWTKTATEARYLWSEYQSHWPPESRPSPDRSKDPPGSWRGEGERYLRPNENSQIEATCDQIYQLERDKFTPAMRDIESREPDRQLVNLQDCRKGRDRIKEKVFDKMEEFAFSSEQAISEVPDVIRYTFQYREAGYTEGIWADVKRLKDHGLELRKLSNSWCENDHYKGINSQWIDTETEQRFEVQFHTRISFEAKQLTHPAYKRVRTGKADGLEELVLEAIQKKVTANVPVPLCRRHP